MNKRILLLLLLPLLTSCADLGYYWHTATGHMAIMDKRQPIEELLTDPNLDNTLRHRLELVKKIRRFAIDRLALPESGSYTDYAQLDRPYALQNLFAAPEFSTQLLSWCYPFAGCTSYRGFYEQSRLDDFVEDLEDDNNDIHIGRVPAYSTLGWFDDPVLSSFIDWPDHRLAGLLFHELTHQRIYIDDDSKFNESLASAVQQVGIRLWLKSHQQTEALEKFDRSLSYRRDIVLLIESGRNQLANIYESIESDERKRTQKQKVFSSLRQQYEDISLKHDYRDGFANWFAKELNNAKLGAVATYNDLIPAFVAIIGAHDHDFERFFNYTEELGDMDKVARDLCLKNWQTTNALNSAACHMN